MFMTDILGLVLLLTTGVVALLMCIWLIIDYAKNRKPYHILWAISMAVLFVSGVLIILFDWGVLENALVPAVAALIPVGFATGLLYVTFENRWYARIFGVLEVLLIITLVFLRYFAEDLSTAFIMIIHIPAGLAIVILPIYTAIIKDTEMTSIMFSIGGLLISIGGALLAFLKLGSAILSAETIFLILPGLLLIVGALISLGIIFPTKWRPTFEIFNKKQNI
jgi:hypothetical protein